MELGVWVEGSLRVVCGLSVHTSVQEVVIALAQDLGQTGRYVLTLKLHGYERQLVKDDCPLQELSVLGHNSKDAQFFLRRTGPSSNLSNLSSSRDRLLPRTRTPDPLPAKAPREPSSLYGTYPRRGRNKRPPAPSVEQEALYVQVLQQTRRIQELGENIEELERRTPNPELDRDVDQGLERDLREQLEALEERQRQNEEELGQEEYWRGQLEEEERRAQDLNLRLEQLQWSVHQQTQRLDTLMTRSRGLQTGVRERSEEALRPLQEELQQRHLQGQRVSAALEETQRLMHTTDHRAKSQRELLEELSKDIRQCNLQQFILQASGSAPSELLVQSGPGGVPSDLTNLLHVPEIYLSNAGIME